MEQEIGFCTTSEGVKICYATVGEGTPLVKAANWLSHLVLDWDSSVWKHWWQELSKNHRLIRYDERGCGLSDWSTEDQSFDSWVSDLESVIDTLALERFPLLGISQGGAVAVEYAVRHPERVSHLVLYGAFGRGQAKRRQSPQVQEEQEALYTLMTQGWGRDNAAYRQIFTSMFIPEGTAEQMRWLNDLQRVSSSPENAVKIRREYGNIDILDRLAQVAVPTLVLHGRGDAAIPFEEGRLLASMIPNAKFVPLDSQNHILLASEPAWPQFLSEVRSFLGVAGEPNVPAAHSEGRTPNHPHTLTDRELEVLRLVAVGKTDRGIAEELVISVGTASTHVKNILNKTDSANRAEATAYAVRNGLV